MSNIRVINDSYTYVTREQNKDDAWDADDTKTINRIEGIQIVSDKGWNDLTTSFDVKEGEVYYLLYAVYDTGDSFHRSDGQIEYVGLYQSRDVAEDNAKRIKEHDKIASRLNRSYCVSEQERKQLEKLRKTFEQYSVNLITEDGKEYKISCPWVGYFEILDDVEVVEVMVETSK